MKKIEEIERAFESYTRLDTIKKTMVNWLMEREILVAKRDCYGKSMSLNSREKEPDLYCWHCTLCRKVVKIRAGSFFETHSSTPLIILARIIFFYFSGGLEKTQRGERIRHEIQDTASNLQRNPAKNKNLL
eukprot:TRINITY_DN3242_c1_g1_i3.p2 TRINITY_DN3242_c1_g1~~TRINITY_DN3242_c1_g1_i3.p2  ORF type:complete len:131 (+),score=1.11 TRINITY_DN3242_c1_g1_i3:364-756(+)